MTHNAETVLDRSGTRFLGSKVSLAGLGLALMLASPAWAHHPSGGQTPDTWVEGLLSGLGHPVVGLDHLAFVIAAGLLAAVLPGGIWLPVTFVLASMVGTGVHLMEITLPAAELVISASVLVFGVLLARQDRPGSLGMNILAAIAGIFHGYAYGEAVVGASMGPLVAYLAGFAGIQLAVALGAYGLARRLGGGDAGALNLRFAGFTLAGVGLAFLAGVVLG